MTEQADADLLIAPLTVATYIAEYWKHRWVIEPLSKRGLRAMKDDNHCF